MTSPNPVRTGIHTEAHTYCTLSEFYPQNFTSMPLGALLAPFPVEVTGPENWRDFPISRISLNTHSIEPETIFVAIGGLTSHGAKYARKAVKQGASTIITDLAGKKILDRDGILAEFPNLVVGVVDNPRQYAADLSMRLFDNPAQKLDLFAVTGTNGKTTTSFMIRQMLSDDLSKVLFTSTVYNQVGEKISLSLSTTNEAPVIQTLLATAVSEDIQMGVVEASSHALELERLRGTHFKISAFTNLSPEHIDFHKSLEEYFKAKAKLFTPAYSDRGVICVDTDEGRKLAQSATIPCVTVAVISSKDPQDEVAMKADWRSSDITVDLDSLYSQMRLTNRNGDSYLLRINLLGEVYLQDAALAFITVVEYGIDPELALERLQRLTMVPGRMNIYGGKKFNQPLVVVDFAHTPDAIAEVITQAKLLTEGKVHVVVAHDGDRDAHLRPLIGQVAAAASGDIWVSDCNPRSEDPGKIRTAILEGIKSVRPSLCGVHEITTDRVDAIREAIRSAKPGEVVLLLNKGNESFQEISGVKHSYSEEQVVIDVLKYLSW